MDDRDPRGDLGKRQRPIDRRIAAAGDHDAAAAEILAPAHQIEDAALLVFGYALQRRAVRAEGAGAGRDHDRAGGDALPRHVLQEETVPAFFETADRAAEVEARRKR